MLSSPSVSDLPSHLLANLKAFQAFAQKRLGDEQLAADVVQDSLLKALKAAPRLRDDENLIAWFYRILRNSIIDLHRQRAVQTKALERFAQELEQQATPEAEQTLCGCFQRLLPTLNRDYAQVLQWVDLDGQSHDTVATQLGISRNLLKVRLHRARQQLRERLEATCQLCATHGCLDCTCDSPT